jgi:hypothetical protein
MFFRMKLVPGTPHPREPAATRRLRSNPVPLYFSALSVVNIESHRQQRPGIPHPKPCTLPFLSSFHHLSKVTSPHKTRLTNQESWQFFPLNLLF